VKWLNKVYAYYLTEHFETVTANLIPSPEGPEPLQYVARRLHRLARKEELERRMLSPINGCLLYSEAREAYAALSTLLGSDAYFFNESYHPPQLTNLDGLDYWMLPYLHTYGLYWIDLGIQISLPSSEKERI
jgi:hypothetical protein